MSVNNLRTLVRPVVTVIMSLAICAGFFSGKLSADQFMPVASAVMLFWFGSRTKAE